MGKRGPKKGSLRMPRPGTLPHKIYNLEVGERLFLELPSTRVQAIIHHPNYQKKFPDRTFSTLSVTCFYSNQTIISQKPFELLEVKRLT